MRKFFHDDTLLFTMMGTIANLIVLNVLTLLCALPVFTAGAAFTAMHDVLWHMARAQEGYVSRQFFQSFRNNFKQATTVWCAWLGLLIIVIVDIVAAWSLPAIVRRMAVPALLVVGLILLVIAQYFFPLLSRYRQSSWSLLVNAAKLALGYVPRSFAMLAITIASAAIYLKFFPGIVPGVVLLGITLPQYCCTLIYDPVLQRIES